MFNLVKASKGLAVLLFVQSMTMGWSSVAQAAPTSVKITKVSADADSISANWSVKNSVKGQSYKFIYRNESKKTAKELKTTKNSIVVNKLPSLTKFSIQVLVYASNKVIAKSSIVYTNTLDEGVSDIEFLANSHTSGTLVWTPSTTYTSYKIKVNNSQIIDVKTSKYDLAALDPTKSNTVQIAGVNGAGVGAYSEPLALELLTNGPKNLVTTSATATTIAVKWDTIIGATKYNVYRDSILIASPTTTAYTLQTLKPGYSGAISVSAVIGSFETNKSEIKAATLVDTPAAPTATSSTATSITVSWTANLNATGYVVNLSDASGVLIKSYVASSTATSYTITGLSAIPPYTVTLTHQYGDASSKPSPATAITTSKEVPTGLKANAITRTTFTLTWNQVVGATGYEVLRDGASLVVSTDGSVTSYAVTGSAGVTYSMTVKARFLDPGKTVVTSEPSTALSVTMLVDPSLAPTSATAPTITLPYATVPIIGATITSNSGVWGGTPIATSFTYRWQKSVDGGTTWNFIPGATSSSYTLVEADFQSILRSEVTATNVNGSLAAFSTSSGIVNAVYNVGVPVLRGSLVVGQTLDATQGAWSSPLPLSYSYQWYRGSSAISGATNTNYTLTTDDVATNITCRVTAVHRLGSLEISSAPRNNVQATANTVAPVISGTLRVGSALSTTTGTWLNDPTFTYQWQRSTDNVLWDSIASATSSSYTLTSSDAGTYVRVVVYGNKTISTAYRVGAPTAGVLIPVPNYTITNTVAPVVSGSWTTGQTLTASNGSWTATGTFTYQWETSTAASSGFTAISGATSRTYVLTSSEAGQFVRVKVYNTTSTGDGVAYSIATSKVNAPYNTALPAITSSLRVGNTQSVTTGTWDNTPTSYTYQWQSSIDGIAWSDADTGTASSYVATFDVANKYIRVLVTAINATGSTTVTIGNISGFLPPVATAIPVISGTVSGTNTLTTSTGTWPSMNGQTPYEYQWQRSSDGGATWTNISGALSSTYALVAADQGYIIRSQVSVRTNSGTSTIYSIPTAAVG